jgi:hypothetical protein
MKEHEQLAYRVCLGVLNLSKSYPAERLNNACRLANHHKLYRLKNIKEILISNQDKLAHTLLSTEPTIVLPQDHENIRGPQSFH